MSLAKHCRDQVMEYVPVTKTTPAADALDAYRSALREEFYSDALHVLNEIELASAEALSSESRLLLSWIKTALDSLVD